MNIAGLVLGRGLDGVGYSRMMELGLFLLLLLPSGDDDGADGECDSIGGGCSLVVKVKAGLDAAASAAAGGAGAIFFCWPVVFFFASFSLFLLFGY